MRSSCAVLMVSLLGLLTFGCNAKTLRFSAISTKQVDIAYESGGHVEGEDCVFVFIVPFGTTMKVDAAVRNAIASKGNALKDARISVVGRPFRSCTRVTGEVVTIRSRE